MAEIRLDLFVGDTELEADRLDQATRHLMGDLRDLGAEAVEPMPGDALPEGAKAVESVLVGGLILSVLPEFLPKLVDLLQTWLQRADTRTVKIKTANGTEVEFAPKKRLTPDEVVELVKKLNAPPILRL